MKPGFPSLVVSFMGGNTNTFIGLVSVYVMRLKGKRRYVEKGENLGG